MIEDIARRARAAALELAALDGATRNRALQRVKEALVRRREEVSRANAEDKREALLEVEAGRLTRALWKRLDIEGAKLDVVLAGLDD
ncbi:MAG: gamma-glutamyl-phosphate reductase, partial [Planctomycetes bacterium]|nr:gamma-glutamyl-phosphate reductase [Planctomycetota bacterium]